MRGMRVVRVDHSTHGFRRRVAATRRVTMIRANQFTGVPDLTSIREMRNADRPDASRSGRSGRSGSLDRPIVRS